LRELANFYRLSDIKIKWLRLVVGVEPGGFARGAGVEEQSAGGAGRTGRDAI